MRVLPAVLAALLWPMLALAQNQLPAIPGPGGYQTAAPTVQIGYDDSTQSPCVVGKTATCTLKVSSSGGGGGGGGAVYGPTASGSPPANPPVLVAGWDGVNLRTINVSTSGVVNTNIANTVGVLGNVTSGGTDSGGPVKVGGVFNTTQPTVTTGQRVDFQTTNRGEQLVSISNAGVQAVLAPANVDTTSVNGVGLYVNSRAQSFNGTSWDRQRDATAADATTGTGLAGAGILGKYNATLPTYTNGQYGNVQLDTRGRVQTTINGTAVSSADSIPNANGVRVDNAAGAGSTLQLEVRQYSSNGTSWDRNRTIQGTDATGLGVQAVANNPNSADGSAATFSAGTTVLGSWVAKASPGNLYGLNVTAGATALFVMVFDLITPPADGAVQPKWCLPLAANAGLDKVFNPPLRGAVGLTIVASSTGCLTKTTSATAFISTQAK